MDDKIINNLAKKIEKYNFDSSYRLGEVMDDITLEFKDKDIREILDKTKEYAENLNGNEKNINIFIVVLALVIVNIDDTAKLKDEIQEHNLEGPLYGGVLIFLKGESKKLFLDIDFRDNQTTNNYQYIMNGVNLDYFRAQPFIELFELQFCLDKENFERLIINDQSNFILILIINDYLEMKISQELGECILKGEDKFKKNLVLYIISKPIVKILNKIKKAKKQEEFFKEQPLVNITIKELEHGLHKSIKCFYFYLEILSPNEQTSFIIDFLLEHQDVFPTEFVWKLFSDNLFKYFINTYEERYDIFYELLRIIENSNVLEEYELSKNKKKQLDVILITLQVNFINKYPNRLSWERYGDSVKFLHQNLTGNYINTFKDELLAMRKKLISNELDQLIRPMFYYKDINKDDYIGKILHIFETKEK